MLRKVLGHLSRCSQPATTRKQQRVLAEANSAVREYTHSLSDVQELDLKTKLAALPTATLIDCCAANGIVAGTWTHAYSPDYRQDLIHALT